MDADVPSPGSSHEPNPPPSPDSQSTTSSLADDGVPVLAWCCRESQGLAVHHCPVCTGCMCGLGEQQRQNHLKNCQPAFEYTTKVGDVTRSKTIAQPRLLIPASGTRGSRTRSTELVQVRYMAHHHKRMAMPYIVNKKYN